MHNDANLKRQGGRANAAAQSNASSPPIVITKYLRESFETLLKRPL